MNNAIDVQAERVSEPPEQTQALARVESGAIQHASSPLDMEPAAFKAGLDRRKENRQSLMEWIRQALVENVDFGRIPTKRGPSKPSLWKPGAEKICGMLGVLVTFPNLRDYEAAALNGTKIENIILRCEITSAGGGIVASGVGARSLSQDYGDLNKTLKMAEKSAHIDATLRLAGLSEIFSQDLEDLPAGSLDKTRQNAPGGAGSAPPPSRQAPAPKAGAPRQQQAPAGPKGSSAAAETPFPSEATKKWFLDELAKTFSEHMQTVAEFFEKAGIIMPNENLADIPLRWVPNSRAQFRQLGEAIGKFGAGDEAVMPYKSHPEPGEPKKKAEPKKETAAPAPSKPVQGASGRDSEWWRAVVVPIPRRGMKRDEYLKNPDTIGSLYEQRHEQTADGQEARQRLWGFVSNYEPKGWTKRDGTEMPASQTDKDFRVALDAFADWFEKEHPGEKL